MPDSTLYQHWLNTVERAPDKVLLTDASTAQTWSAIELQRAVQALDQSVNQSISWSGKRVMLPLSNSVNWLTSFLLCLKRNAIPLLLDPATPPQPLRQLIAQFRPIALRTDHDWETFPQPQQHDDAHLIKLVAGSDGQPQALPFCDHHLLADLRQILSSMAIQSEDSHYALIPLGHSYGLSSLVLPLIVEGIPMVLASNYFPSAIANDLSRFRPTLFPAIPTVVRALVRSSIDPACFASLRHLISAGDHLQACDAIALLEKFGIRAHNFYGTSETGGIAYDRTGDATLSGQSVGTPLDGVRVALRDDHRLIASSPAIPSSNSFVTADYAEILPSDEIRLTRRAPHLIKISGRRLNPLEIETPLREIPETRAANLETYADSFGELRTRLTYDGPLNPTQVRDLLATALPRWKIPHRIIHLSQ